MKHKITIIFILLYTLVGCGYQLRQAKALGPEYERTYLDLSVNSPLYRPLFTELRNGDIEMVNSASESTAQLVITSVNMQRVVQSIGANNRVQEYRLDLYVKFEVVSEDKLVLNAQDLRLSKDYAFDIQQITGAQQEEAVLREQLFKEMARMLVDRIARQ